jgi:uncharacterized protein
VLAAGSAFAAAGLLLPSASLQEVGGWLFVAAAVFGLYAGAALMLESVYGIAVLPLLRRGQAEPVEYARGDPGVKVGQ